MKTIAFTPYGYWQSRRNRGDLLVTILGVIWIAINNAIHNEYTLTLGYVVIILRYDFCFFSSNKVKMSWY